MGKRALITGITQCRFYFAGSSEMFGKAEELPQTERTRFHPRSSYGIGKGCGLELPRNYREAFGLHASNGILFNQESPRRGFEFVTRKITSGVTHIPAGRSRDVKLGNLEAQRDWSHAREYVNAMWLMVQQPEPDDYVIATGETHTVREFVELAFSDVGLDYRSYVATDPTLGWTPRTTFESSVCEMVGADCRALGVERDFRRRETGQRA